MVLAARMRLVPVAYLVSYLLSLLGNAIAGIALPLIVLQTTGSALGAATVAAATAVPAVLAGLFMGVVIDRVNRRTSSVLTDLISAVSVAALPVVSLGETTFAPVHADVAVIGLPDDKLGERCCAVATGLDR